MIFNYKDKETREMFRKYRSNNGLNSLVVTASGFFDPLHVGHITYLKEVKEKYVLKDDVFIVIVNGDNQAKLKKGKPFMPAIDRATILNELWFVDHVFIYDSKTTTNSVKALEIIRPRVFAKGDNSSDVLPEEKICDKLGIKVVRGLGDTKVRASSNYLKEWFKFSSKKK